VSKGNGQGCCVVADRKGIGADDGCGWLLGWRMTVRRQRGGWCAREEGLGRCAAEAVLGGVVPLRVLGRLVQHMEEADHLRREGASGLRREEVCVCDVTLCERVGVVARPGIDAVRVL